MDEMATTAEPGQDLVADGAGGGGDIVDRRCSAPISVAVSPRRTAPCGSVGDVDADQIHRDAADERAALAGDDGGAAGLRSVPTRRRA